MDKELQAGFLDEPTGSEGHKKQSNMQDVGITMDLETFLKKVDNGEISDDTGLAELLINGTMSNYHVHIDRRCVTRGDGTLITYVGLLKMHKPEELSILYKRRSRRMMNLAQYKRMMRERDRKQGKQSWI
ncbi:MAG: hypothetical protein K6G04_07410 [Lachnospiraceae bacterium]|nr:hypothetical protein [Lachnospiraceae bacterium]